MWVQLRSAKTVNIQGVSKRFQAGDYVNVGKQTALLWISQREAVMPGVNYLKEMELTTGAGALIIGPDTKEARAPFADIDGGTLLDITFDAAPSTPYDKTIIWTPPVALRKELIPIGLSLLDTWQIALPLYSYTDLACHVGDEAERAMMGKIIPDLRVPLYETGLIFARRCNETTRLFAVWRKELERGASADGKLAFLRALYQMPMLVLALPVSWHRVNE